MPVLREIELFLDATYPAEERRAFIFKSRCMCNYLERALVQKQFETTRSRINIHSSREAGAVRVHPLKSEPFLEVSVNYDLPRLSELDDASLCGHFARIINLGLGAAEQFMPVPRRYCVSALRRFMERGCKNEWIQAEKHWDKLSLRCQVSARLSIEAFSLWQHVYRGGELVAGIHVAETKPREMLFVNYLGKLSLDRSGNIVYRCRGKVLTKFDPRSSGFLVPRAGTPPLC